jgi:hypothetical protein
MRISGRSSSSWKAEPARVWCCRSASCNLENVENPRPGESEGFRFGWSVLEVVTPGTVGTVDVPGANGG